jgi:hypothetical protein
MKYLKHFEAIIEEPIDFPDQIVTRWTISTYEITEGNVARREFRLPGEPITLCSPTSILTVNGTVRVDNSGQASLKMSNYICDIIPGRNFAVYYGPLNFLLTPKQGQPSMFNGSASIDTDGRDISLDVSSYDSNGDPSGGSFYWQLKCRFVEQIG